MDSQSLLGESAGNQRLLYAQYESDFDNFRNENDGQPTANRNISIVAPLPRICLRMALNRRKQIRIRYLN